MKKGIPPEVKMKWQKTTWLMCRPVPACKLTLAVSVIATVFLFCKGGYVMTRETPNQVSYQVAANVIGTRTSLQTENEERKSLSSNPKDSNAIHVLLTAYHRSGSSFTGHLLTSKPNTFYFYEPLINLGQMGYFSIDNRWCDDLTGKCRKLNGSSEERKPLQAYMKRHKLTDKHNFVDILYHVILGIYNCHLIDTEKLIVDGVTDLYARHQWIEYINCRKRNTTKLDCLPHVISNCQESNIHVIKVVRLSLDMVRPLLHLDPALKIIHLFRDPRDIIHSRLVKTDWYPLTIREENYQPALKHAQILCLRMLKDLIVGKQLLRALPNRVRLVRYEDIFDYDDAATTTEIFQLLDLNSNNYSHKQNSNSSHRWSTELEKATLPLIDSVCSLIYKKLGYIQTDFDTLRNNKSFQKFIPQSRFKLE